MSLRLRKCRAVLMTASALCLVIVSCAPRARAQTPTPTPSPSIATSAPCAQAAPCPRLAPRVIQLSVIYKRGDQPLQQDDKVTQLARKRFYLSSCPFNLEKLSGANSAPTRKGYYTTAKASPQLIKWLEDN